MTHYVLGFYFTKPVEDSWYRVLLLEKNKPDYQKGKLNGLGGKIECGETPLEAMKREFAEESLYDGDVDWQFRFIIAGKDFAVSIFSAFGEQFELKNREVPEGKLFWISPDVLSSRDHMPNLDWILPLLTSECGVFEEYSINSRDIEVFA